MAELLTGKKLAKAIRGILKEESGGRFAVAFWGPAAGRLAAVSKAKVVLDISMGGTSRNALEALGAPSNRAIRVLDRLHAKLYIGANKAVVASSNASKNALGDHASPPQLHEIGVVFDKSQDADAYAEAERQFERLWRAGRQVNGTDLERAVSTSSWLATRDQIAGGAKVGFSILANVLHDPERFSSTVFIFGDEQLTTKDAEAARAAYRDNQGHDARNDGRQLICVTYDPDDGLLLRGAAYVVEFWFGTARGLRAYHDIMPVDCGDGSIAFFGRSQWSTVRASLGLSSAIVRQGYWENDRERGLAIAASDGDDVKERFVLLSHDRLHEVLERGE